MDQTPPSRLSYFQDFFSASVEKYRETTKIDLLTHPLTAQLQTCNSPTDILAVLRTRVQQFEQSTRRDDKLINCLKPIVNVVYAFSEALGTGVELVSSIRTILLRSNL
jgi:hypothetical protein